MVAKLDPLSRSKIDFTALIGTAQKQHWALAALAVDASTPASEAMANMLATFAQFERRLISQRTKEALAVKRAAGIRLGRPPTLPQTIVLRIRRQRARGDSLRRIAEDLNESGVPRRVERDGTRRRYAMSRSGRRSSGSKPTRWASTWPRRAHPSPATSRSRTGPAAAGS